MQKKILSLIFVLFLLVCSLTLAGCKPSLSGKKIMFKTGDGFNIVGNLYDAHADKAVILTHMLNSNKESWHDFALQLKEKGYTVLAIDMRGHGESNIQNGQISLWRSFGPQEYNNMVLDVEAAMQVLELRGIAVNKIILGGASIGANVMLNTAGRNPGVGAVFLLSPGMDYKGISVANALNTTTAPVYILVSKGDTYSFQSSSAITKALRARNVSVQMDSYQSGTAHGTDQIAQYKDAADGIIKWLDGLGI